VGPAEGCQIEILLSKERRRIPLHAGVASDSYESWCNKR
jgi:hypothetical protein